MTSLEALADGRREPEPWPTWPALHVMGAGYVPRNVVEMVELFPPRWRGVGKPDWCRTLFGLSADIYRYYSRHYSHF